MNSPLWQQRSRELSDVVDSRTRSRMMSGIRGVNTRPELQVRRLLHRSGFRFRLHRKDLPGKPDIVLPRYRAVILVNGCFWHGHDCHLFKWPQTREDWWRTKIRHTMFNDSNNLLELRNAGWRVAVVWECALKGKERISDEEIAISLAFWLRSVSEPLLEIRGKKKE